MKEKGTQFATVFHQANPKSMGGVSHHTVEAWAPEHADEPWAKAHPTERMGYEGSSVDPGIRPLSSLSWQHKTGEIKGVHTDPEHRRMGLASALHQKAQEIASETRCTFASPLVLPHHLRRRLGTLGRRSPTEEE